MKELFNTYDREEQRGVSLRFGDLFSSALKEKYKKKFAGGMKKRGEDLRQWIGHWEKRNLTRKGRLM